MEELRRVATPVGNGSHILVPKEWEGYEVVLTKVAEVDPKKEILEILYTHLENVIGVYVYGSYARKEFNKTSDVDILVVTNKKISVDVKKPFDVTFVEKSRIEAFKKLNPVMFYSILSEAETILNEDFLNELRGSELKSQFRQYLKAYLEDTGRAARIDRQLLESGAPDANLIYSVLLRLRGLLISENLLKNQKFSNSEFFAILKNRLSRDPKDYYDIYKAVRDNKKTNISVDYSDAQVLIEILDSQLKSLKRKLYAK